MTIVWAALNFYCAQTCSDILQRHRLLIAYVCFCWVALTVVFTATAAAYVGNTSEGLWTTTTWFSAGWHTGLGLF